MLRTFNVGVGLTIVSDPKNTDDIINHISLQGVGAYRVGRITRGSGKVDTTGKLRWDKLLI